MAGIAFNLILIRVGQNRSDADESRQGTHNLEIKEGQFSTLQFDIPGSMSQDQSLTDVEEGIPKS